MYTRKGFTLIETLIACGIMAVLVVCVSSMMVTMSVQEERNQVVTEVDTAASSLMDEITQSLRNATLITTPATSTLSTSTLTLVMPTFTGENPTTFTLASSTIRATKGTSSPYRMTNTNVLVTGLSFQNLTASGTKGTIRLTLDVAFNNIANDPRYNYTTKLISTVSLR